MPDTIVSNFDTDADGWTVRGSANDSEWNPNGGDPGGFFLYHGGATSNPLYYVAPSKFTGDKAAYYGGSISYEVDDVATNFAGPADLVLVGANQTLVITLGQAGELSWKKYTASLIEAAGWSVGDTAGPPATADEIRDVLATLQSVEIRGLYHTDNPSYGGGLDNVVMTAPATPGYNLFSGPDESTFLGNYPDFSGALAAAAAGNEIAQVGNGLTQVRAQIDVDNLTVKGGNAFFGDFTLGKGVVSFSASGSVTITDNELDNVMTVSNGVARFIAGLGDDTMNGTGALSTVDYSANTRSMALDLSKTTAQATGGFGKDTLIGIDNVIAGSGNDRISGDDKGNSLDGSSGNDRLYGRGGGDTLIGGNGNDTLDGGAGADFMFGGAGADRYYVDDADDRVIDFDPAFDDSDDGAIDTVVSTISYQLGSYIENLTLSGSANIDGDGNDLDNVIIGNAGDNHLDGGDGNDRLIGGAGNDTLRGGNGNDTLIGGPGADVMNGGEDGDTYFVASNDLVFDDGTRGIDQVISTGGWTSRTGDGIERITTQSTANTSLIGNELDNSIFGGSGNDILKGLAGNDTLYGGGGNDRLEGGAGRDALYGQGGADRFIFAAGDSGATATTYDIVKDFSGAAGDRIDLDVVTKALSDGQYAERTVASDAYTAAYNSAVSAMADGDHTAVFVAGATNGWLFWNTDGNAATPDQSIRLDGVNNVAAFDKSFIV